MGSEASLNPSVDEILKIEYGQIAENIRSGWSYIFNFFKFFIIIQIVLISLVGFGSSSTVTLKSFVLSNDDTYPAMIGLGACLDFKSDDCRKWLSNKDTTSEEYEKHMVRAKEFVNLKKKKLEIKKSWEKNFLVALVVVAFVFSIGSTFHNDRLFAISRSFLERAEKIEIHWGKYYPILKDQKQHYTTMKEKHKLWTRWLLDAMYFVTAIGWLIIGFTFLSPALPSNPFN